MFIWKIFYYYTVPGFSFLQSAQNLLDGWISYNSFNNVLPSFDINDICNPISMAFTQSPRSFTVKTWNLEPHPFTMNGISGKFLPHVNEIEFLHVVEYMDVEWLEYRLEPSFKEDLAVGAPIILNRNGCFKWHCKVNNCMGKETIKSKGNSEVWTKKCVDVTIPIHFLYVLADVFEVFRASKSPVWIIVESNGVEDKWNVDFISGSDLWDLGGNIIDLLKLNEGKDKDLSLRSWFAILFQKFYVRF